MSRKISLFNLGNITITEKAYTLLRRNDVTADSLLRRHARGDWGNTSDESAMRNANAVSNGNRICSCYAVGKRNVVWIVTDPESGMHQAVTRLIRPEEYAHVCTTG